MSNTEEEIRNNFTLIFDSDKKKLKLKDQKGYSYNIAFEDKSNSKSNEDASSINLKRQLKDIGAIVSKIQSTGKIGPVGPEGKRGPLGPKGDKGEEGIPGPGLGIDFLVNHKDRLPKENVQEGCVCLIERILDLYLYKNSKWEFIGNMRGKQGFKGEKGDVGPGGVRGEKGHKGDRFKFDMIIQNEEHFELDKEKLCVEEGDFVITSEESKLYTFQDNGWYYVTQMKGERGEKGDVGDGLNIDIICDDESQLLHMQDKIGSYAMTKNKMELFKNEDKKWNLIGSIKGDSGDKGEKGEQGDKGIRGDQGIVGPKGPRGPKGEQGEQGDKGEGIHIDYFFETYKDLLSNNVSFKKNDVCLILENKELRYWDNEWKNIGTINLSIEHKMDDITYLLGVKLSNVIDQDFYEDIEARHLKFLNWEVVNNDVEWLDLRGNKIFLKPNSKYIIKINLCWSIDESRNIKNILKDGILIFGYLANEIIKGSAKFDKGLPFINSLQHTFFINTNESGELKFFIKILEENLGETNIYSEGSFLEIKKI